MPQSQIIKEKNISNWLKTIFYIQFFIKEFYTILSILFKMAATSYDGTCKNCGANLSVWIEVRKNIEGVPVPEVWCIDCVRSGGGDSNNNNLNIK